MLSVMFSATDSMAPAAIWPAVSWEVSRLTRDDICRRAWAMSPAVRIRPMPAATRCSIRTEKVVFSRAATTSRYASGCSCSMPKLTAHAAAPHAAGISRAMPAP